MAAKAVKKTTKSRSTNRGNREITPAISETRNESLKKVSSKTVYRNIIIVVLILFAISLLWLSKGLFVAALVNGKPVSRFAVIKQLEKNSGKQALDQLVTAELINQQAKKQNIVISDADVKTEIDKISKNIEAQGTTLDAALSQQGMSKSDLEKSVVIQKQVEKLLSSEIQVNDDEVTKYFNDNKDIYGKDAKIENLKDTIKEQLKQQKLSTSFQTWYDKLKSESNIQYFAGY